MKIEDYNKFSDAWDENDYSDVDNYILYQEYDNNENFSYDMININNGYHGTYYL